MSTVSILYSAAGVALSSAQRTGRLAALQQPRVTLRGEAGTTLTLPLVPSSMEHAGLGRRYEKFDRVGLKPVLARGDLNLRTYSFTLVIVARDPNTGYVVSTRSVEPDLRTLQRLADTGERVSWTNLGRIERGSFRITGLSFNYVQRVIGSREVSVAEASVELTEASDVKVRVGPVSGGARKPAPSRSTSSGSGAPAPATERSYTVRKGDTLSAISLRFLGKASRYPEIADLNRISNPNRISVGQVLRIPAT